MKRIKYSKYNQRQIAMDLNFAGEVITRETESYEQSRLIWNRSIDVYPKGMIYCTNTYDVCTAVNFVRSCNERCRIATGSHCSLGHCTDNDVYVINLSRINSCEYNSKFHMVYSGCGATCHSICNTLSSNHCFFPGPDPFSCIGVWSLCGGIGCSCRRYGLGCDFLAQVELVDYRGEVIIASAKQNQDLFWAIRGAGAGNFGIVTGLTYFLPKPVDEVCYFEISIDICTRSTMISFLEVWQDWIVMVDYNINCQVQFCNTFHEGKYIFAYGVSYLSIEATKVQLGPFLTIKGLHISYESRTYISVMNRWNRLFSANERYTNMGRFSYDKYELSDLEMVADMIWGRRAEGSIFTSLTLTGMGGFVSNFSSRDTAFFHRDARFLLSLKTQWFEEDCRTSNDIWMIRNYDYLSSITRGAYINQPFGSYSNYEMEYYGENVSWLRQVKAKYDPNNFFDFPQGIRI